MLEYLSIVALVACMHESNAVLSSAPSLTKQDTLSETTWRRNNFDPKTNVESLSYTSQRVACMLYNVYEQSKQNEIIGYYSDWSQYDGRLDNSNAANKDCGRGIDMRLYYNTDSYDRFIFSFYGIVGDRGSKSQTVASAAQLLQKTENEAIPIDPWGDLAAYRNVGFNGYKSEDYAVLYNEREAQGALGGIVLIQKNNLKYKSTLAMSLGGWTLSQPFHYLTKDDAAVDKLIASLKDFYTKFPSFSQIDVDWEYPNAAGDDGTDYGPEDPDNFQKLLRKIKEQLPNVKVSIAVSADPNKIMDGKIEKYVDYVDYYNVMSYDFVGSFSRELGHHTNLRISKLNKGLSVEQAVNKAKEVGIPNEKINIGYASYSRNLRDVEITSFDPLEGTIGSRQSPVIGTFESNVIEWYDMLANYLHYDGNRLYGKNGYCLYHDSAADADYLYSNKTKIFISLDTPRSVYAKAQYVKEHNLHGMLQWMIEYDNGLLTNAAHEGLGLQLASQKIDMKPFLQKPSPNGDCWLGDNTDAYKDEASETKKNEL